MKKICIILGCVILAAIAYAGTPKPVPPCKWAGFYEGVVTPTSWPSWWLSSGYYPVRSIFTLTIGTNYGVTASQFDYAGKATGDAYAGRIDTSGNIKATNAARNTIVSAKMGGHGVISGSYVATGIGRGTVNAYRETYLP